MEPLPVSFRDRGFLYEQVERQGDVALYTQTNHAGIVRYEVIRIRIQREHTWPNGTTTPEKEAYPGSNSWGTLGWTFTLRPLAEAKLRELQGQPAEPQPVPHPGDVPSPR
jgi:hypothetical protein